MLHVAENLKYSREFNLKICFRSRVRKFGTKIGVTFLNASI